MDKFSRHYYPYPHTDFFRSVKYLLEAETEHNLNYCRLNAYRSTLQAKVSYVGYKILDKGLQDTDCRRWFPVGEGPGTSLARKLLKLRFAEMEFQAFCQHVINCLIFFFFDLGVQPHSWTPLNLHQQSFLENLKSRHTIFFCFLNATHDIIVATKVY